MFSKSKAESGVSIGMTRDALVRSRFLKPVLDFLKHHVYFGLIALALFAVAGIWVLDDYGLGTDTEAQRGIATRNLDYLLGKSDLVFSDSHHRFYGITFELPLLLLERVLGLEDMRDVHLMRHLVTHLFFLAGGFFCYLLAYRLFENRLLAVVGMLLFLLHPRIYAHSFFNSKDIPFLSLFMICLYLTHRAFGNGNIWRFLLLGIAVGVLINLRVMGSALFFSAVAMCVMDMFHASSTSERRRVLSLTGVFMVSCLVTLYAVSPYLWSDPVEGMIEWFVTLSQHPINVYHLFRGDVIVSADVNPPEYVPVWMSITTPPVVLALGVAGVLIVFLRGLMSPRDVLANTRLRFGFLLIGCFMVPIVVSIALSSNVYNDWRQMYFLYAPLCLLAVFGLHQLISMLSSTRLKSGLYGAFGIGLAVAVASMFSIHPHQYLYFSFMVDRTTPEHLRTQYDMDYWHISLREAYQYLLARDPLTSIRARTSLPGEEVFNWEILAKMDRERLILQGEYYDFYITSYKNWLRSESDRLDVAAPLIYSRVVYGSKVLGVAAVDLSLVDDTVAAPYRDAYSATISKKPDARSEWDVYIDGGALVYINESCVSGDFGAPFFLHVTPDDIDDLPWYRRRNGHSTRDFDFEFGRFGVRFDGICMAAVPLPSDGISGIRTGQFTSHGELWSASLNMKLGGASAYRDEYESVIHDNPVINSEFKVYLHDGRLMYVREPCDASDTESEFFLRVVPSDVEDLPPVHMHSGSEVLRFIFDTRGLMFDGMCVASIGLPDYEIESITTWQYDSDEDTLVWVAGYNASAATELPKAVDKLRDHGVEPAVGSYFDVYLDDGRLIYFRSLCVSEDVDAPFFVHVHPADLDDLSPDRQSLGFDSFSFGLLDEGVMSGDNCFTSFDLPDYDVAGFTTGQFMRGERPLWEDGHSFAAAELPDVVDRLRDRGVEPVARSHFDVYMDNDRLIYIREPCDASDVDAEFFLHVVPSDIDDLPPPRRESGFDNLDFVFETHGLMLDGMCIAGVGLPDYDIERIRTGQWDTEQQRDIWKEEFEVATD